MIPQIELQHFRIYESAPWSIEAWNRPLECSPLASARLAGTGMNSTVNSNTVSFFIKTNRFGRLLSQQVN